MVTLAHGTSLRGAVIALALIYVTILRLVFLPLPVGAEWPALGGVICHTGDQTPHAPLDDTHGGCCDACCLMRVAAVIAPLMPGLALVFAIVLALGTIDPRPGRDRTTGPPAEAWSRVRAQRAPPRFA